MLKNYFKIAVRNLLRSKGFSLINITGLIIGMSSAILILLWIYDEVSYDRFHQNKEYLYHAWNRGTFDNKLQCWSSTPKTLGPALKQEYTEIENMSRALSRWFVTVAGETKISTQALVADPSFLSMFSFPLLKGNKATALDGVYSIVVTEKMAKKMFGTTDAMNKVIRIDSNNFTVTGILKDLPSNSKFEFEYLLPWKFLKTIGADDDRWGNNSVDTYVQLKPGAIEASMNAKIKNITKRHTAGTEQQEVFLHPISKWHLYSDFENGKVSGGRIEMVRLFGIIAAFILLIACINFMNLSTARSEKRAKEVGIRKAAGAYRKHLVLQFLGESVLLVFIAGIAALLLVQLVLPSFETLVNKELVVPYGNPYFWLAALAFILITGLVAGSYPAFFLSAFNPIRVLKGTFKRTHAVINPRKVLVVFQFSFAIILIISTCIVVQQLQHARDREAGYDREQLVYHWMTGKMYEKYPLIKNELLASGIAVHVTKTNATLTSRLSDTWDVFWPGKQPNEKIDFQHYTSDEDLVKTAGLQLTQGRDIDLTNYPGDSTSMLLNEAAVQAMGLSNPVGVTIKVHDLHFQVVGVIKNFVLESPYDQIAPMIIEGPKQDWFNVMNIRLAAGRDKAASLQTMEQVFKKYNPEYPFEYHFADEDYAAKFNVSRRIATLTALFATLTIFISCLGLFGLATYMAEARLKEISVRKVLGASVFGITALLSKDFLVLVVIAIFIASPIAWYAMNTWLQNFTYHITIGWYVFVLAGVSCLIISLITIGYQAIRAAFANPAKTLRTE
jgi:putative ABC transport system permease protein